MLQIFYHVCSFLNALLCALVWIEILRSVRILENVPFVWIQLVLRDVLDAPKLFLHLLLQIFCGLLLSGLPACIFG